MMAQASKKLSRFNVAALALGLLFLYLPIAILVIYSFNASRLVTVWGGWSLRWYSGLFNDHAMLDAVWMSLRVAVTSATLATLLGTLAAVALSRGTDFSGRTLFSGMLYAPLVMPEVIAGLSLLLLFVAIGAERGFWTVTIAHTTLTMCFVAVVVQSRLGLLDRPDDLDPGEFSLPDDRPEHERAHRHGQYPHQYNRRPGPEFSHRFYADGAVCPDSLVECPPRRQMRRLFRLGVIHQMFHRAPILQKDEGA